MDSIRVNYLLSRLTVCDVCGAHFCGRRLLQKERNGSTTEKFAYYCGGYLNKGTAVCASLPIPKHWLQGTILKLMRAQLCEPEGLAEVEDKTGSGSTPSAASSAPTSRSLEQKLGDIDRRIENCVNAIGDGLDASIG